MPDLKDIRKTRMAGIRGVRKAQKQLDSTNEVFERWLLKALKWREKIPGQKDLEVMIDYAEALEWDHINLQNAIGDAVRVFAI